MEDTNQEQQQVVEPLTLQDPEGNEVKAIPVEKYNEQAERIKKLEEDLSKLQNKDFNFENLRKKSEEEKSKIIDKMSTSQKMLYEQIEKLTVEKEQEYKTRMDEATKGVLDALCGSDEEARKAIELQEKEFIGEAKTPKEKEERLRKAYLLVKGTAPRANTLNSPLGTTYREPDMKRQKYTDTPEGSANYSRYFPNSPSQRKK